VNRLLVEGIVALVLLVAGWGWFIHHDHQQQAIGAQAVIDADANAVKRQKGIDDAVLATAVKHHEAEMASVASGYAAALRDLQSRLMQPRPVTPSTCAAQDHTADQSGSTGGGSEVVRVPDYPDLRYPYLVLAHRLDELNAAARQVNEVSQ